MSIAQNITALTRALPPHVQLIAVSKRQSIAHILKAYAAGQCAFGESRPQELQEKAAQLPSNIEWHFIGHLQLNKVKIVTGLAAVIHSCDSERLLEALNKEADKQKTVQKCLLQVHIGEEKTKYGFSPEALARLATLDFLPALSHLQIIGLMGMATFTEKAPKIHQEFRLLQELHTHLKQTLYKDHPAFCELSMGMSNDYRIAVAEGSSMVRIGTSIFDE